jgi:hypothetical protein
MISNRTALLLLRFWWARPIYRYAFRKVLIALENGAPGVLGMLLSDLWSSNSVRLSSTLIELLLLLPDELLNSNSSLNNHFAKELFLRETVRERLQLCRTAILMCFKGGPIDYSFLATRHAGKGQKRVAEAAGKRP